MCELLRGVGVGSGVGRDSLREYTVPTYLSKS